MGSSSSSSSYNTHENSNIETNERFHFRFTDCSCQCNANKRPGGVGGVGRDNDLLPQATFMNAFMTQTNRSQYDIQCNCDCGEGVKLGFLFGNTSSSSKIDN